MSLVILFLFVLIVTYLINLIYFLFLVGYLEMIIQVIILLLIMKSIIEVFANSSIVFAFASFYHHGISYCFYLILSYKNLFSTQSIQYRSNIQYMVISLYDVYYLLEFLLFYHSVLIKLFGHQYQNTKK